ncbi:MAG: PKD domain-containing protein [Verrucomicrobiales bacterium]|nr:PKD domain-containing protein [Verrucomicrobiales bacterium]
MKKIVLPLSLLCVLILIFVFAQKNKQVKETVPPFETFDLNIGESFKTGKGTKITLVSVQEPAGKVWSEISRAEVTVSVDGEEISLVAGMYRLPQTIGSVQVDCPVTGGLRDTSHIDHWALEKDARIRAWPKEGPWIAEESFGYPLKQRWFASHTAFSNEPVAGRPNGKLYYHAGMDFGGCEALTEVVAATDAIVVSAGEKILPGHEPITGSPVKPRYDVLYLLDSRGWYYRYSHFHSFDPGIQAGSKVKIGQRLGLVGKEGGSGGWTHLHFEIKSRQPSGRWGTEDSYAFLWQGYRKLYGPEILAVARPGHMIFEGESVTHDGSRSWSKAGDITKFEWRFSDGTTASGPSPEKTYPSPGSYRETLIVTDSNGISDVNFVRVKVFSKGGVAEDSAPPRVHATYHPTLKIKAGEPVTFKCRAFGTTHGEETWDFGDGSPTVTTKSDGNAEQLNPDGYAVVEHTYEKPGEYFVHVFRKDERGRHAEDRLFVRVDG